MRGQERTGGRSLFSHASLAHLHHKHHDLLSPIRSTRGYPVLKWVWIQCEPMKGVLWNAFLPLVFFKGVCVWMQSFRHRRKLFSDLLCRQKFLKKNFEKGSRMFWWCREQVCQCNNLSHSFAVLRRRVCVVCMGTDVNRSSQFVYIIYHRHTGW